MVTLLVEHVREIRGQAGLRQPHMKAVRKTMTQKAVESPHSIRPVIGKRKTVAAVHREFGTPRICGPDFESGREDQAVHLIFHPVYHHPALSYPLYASA